MLFLKRASIAKIIRCCICVCCTVLLLNPQAFARSQKNSLEDTQELYAAAIRWSDFSRAEVVVDPQYLVKHPITDFTRERYQQIEVSRYEPLRTEINPDGSVSRLIALGVINRNTQSARTVQYTERWRWDPVTQTWLLASGLPDLWSGH